jgi:hypothetical protein
MKKINNVYPWLCLLKAQTHNRSTKKLNRLKAAMAAIQMNAVLDAFPSWKPIFRRDA